MPEKNVVRIQERGQITLPIEVRRQLGLKTGDLVTIIATPEGALIIPQEVAVQRALDRLGEALRAGGLSLDDLIESGREERGRIIEEMYGIRAADNDS